MRPIDKLLDKHVNQLKGFSKIKNGKYCYSMARIYFNNNAIILGNYSCPYTASLVYWLVKKEICPNYLIEEVNDKFMINKTINYKKSTYGYCNSLEEAMEERDKLIECDWDLDLWVEGNDETLNGKIIFNNKFVGEVKQ